MGFATYYSLMFCLLLLPLLATAQTTNNGRIDVNASLIAADNASYWLSPSKEFAFGFLRPENEHRFLLSIWFEQIPEKTVVWWSYEKETEFPVLVEAGSKVVLTSSGLVLRNPQGEERWRSVLNTGQVDHGVMEDTGNMVLVGPNSSDDQLLWRSFDNPSDTLLPTQEMGLNGQLFSRKKENDFSLGKFQLHIFDNGTLTINVINLPTRYIHGGPYYSSDDNNPNASNSGVGLIFDKSGDVYMLRKNGEKSPIGSGSKLPIQFQSSDYYQRVTLDVDGVFAQYYYPKKSNGSWSTAWLQPVNICSWTSPIGSGACGFNSICRLNEGARPTCECAPGFFLTDKDDTYGGCIRDDELNYCQKDAFELETRKNINWPLADYERYGESYTEKECRDSCWDDCMCVVAIYNADGSCFKKRLPLSNGRYDNNDRSVSFVKVRKGGRSTSDPSIPDAGVPNVDHKDKNEQIFNITGSILLGTSLFVNLVFISAFCFTFFVIYKKMSSKVHKEDQLETNLRVFTYKQLSEATNGFTEELGRGAFGVVYKGTMQMAANNIGSCRTNIAVKKLDGVVKKDGYREFKTEIIVIGQTHHKNLVRLLGFCEEGEQRLLVYECLSNGTLADYLFGNRKPSWNQRTQIAFGIARGLQYLHEECTTQIIHCDVKPQNILLDDYYNARISDFGLAKLLVMDQSHTKTAIRGTKGYVAPEWFRNLPVTVKVDVYSFGVILLEIICCRRSVVNEEIDDEEENGILSYWAYDCFQGGRIEDLVRDDMEAINDMKSLEKFLMVAFWCIQEDPYLRPTMRKVTQMLEGVVQVAIPPNPSPFTTIE